MSDEFYIGYRKVAPPSTGRFVTRAAVAFVLVVTSLAFALGALQDRPSDGHYAFGNVESFEGQILEGGSLPMVAIQDSGESRLAILVNQGKHGIPDYARDAINHTVRFDATRIERDGVLMLELAGPDRFEVLDEIAIKVNTPIPLSTTLVGELVDTKCYLGVMNPGQGKVHRGCAAECLRGGVPPGLLVRDEDGSARVVLISVAPEIIDPEWAGRTVEISGAVRDTGEFTMIRAEAVRLLP